jgi:pimeloyl-ACP methyl ester carboxylesterase
MGSPIVYVHGIGASARVWKKFDAPDHDSFYISFSDPFADPALQAKELAKFILKILQQTGQSKVILVCHSMGCLVARKYLVDNTDSHHVEKVILLSALNLGSVGLSFNWLPLFLILVGGVGFRYVWPLIFVVIGLLWETMSYLRGILLLSAAAWAMRPRSKFLKALNSKLVPSDVKYVAVLNDTKVFPHVLVNLLLFREGGDGAVPVSSQRLSDKCVPNFSELNYHELHTNLPHFAVPKKAQPEIFEALKL